MNQYLECIYRDGGRGPAEYDCFGLVRQVRHFELGLKLLPEYGSLRNTSPRDFTKAYRAETYLLRECGPEHGAIAAVLIGEICIHVALVLLVEGRFKILEINPTRGPRMLPLEKWLRDHNRVTFHND